MRTMIRKSSFSSESLPEKRRRVAGYGHIAPSTVLGKLFTMIYTVIGIPLFMLYVASIGDILARVFKWTYSR